MEEALPDHHSQSRIPPKPFAQTTVIVTCSLLSPALELSPLQLQHVEGVYRVALAFIS